MSRKRKKKSFSRTPSKRKLKIVQSPQKPKKRKLNPVKTNKKKGKKRNRNELSPKFHRPKPRFNKSRNKGSAKKKKKKKKPQNEESTGSRTSNLTVAPPPPPNIPKQIVQAERKETRSNQVIPIQQSSLNSSFDSSIKKRFSIPNQKQFLSSKRKKTAKKKTVFRGGEKLVQDPLIDWSLKRKVTIISSNENLANIVKENKSIINTFSKKKFINSSNFDNTTSSSHQISTENSNHHFSESFQQCLYYYEFTTLDLSVQTDSEIELDRSEEGDISKLPLFRKMSREKPLQSVQKENWSESFTSIYRDFANGTIPYFYCYYQHGEFLESSCIFISSGISGEENPVRAVFSTKSQYRKILKEFETMWNVKAVENDQKRFFIISGRINVQGFANFIHCKYGELYGCVIYSPSPFLNSTLKKNRVNVYHATSSIGMDVGEDSNQMTKRKKRRRSDNKKHILEIEGLLLPHNIQNIVVLLKSMSRSVKCTYRVNLETKDITSSFNSLICHQEQPSPGLNVPDRSSNREKGPGYFRFMEDVKDGDFSYLEDEEDEDLKGRIVEGYFISGEEESQMKVSVSKNYYM